MGLKIGNLAPNFKLENDQGQIIELKQFRGEKNVILYFYPKAMTPGCTTQACGIRDFKKKFLNKKTIVLAISPDSVERLAKFKIRDQLNFDLLSDPDHKVALQYHSWGPKKFMGKEYEGILRQTFIIGMDGRLKKIVEKVNTKTHHEDALSWIDLLERGELS